MAMDFPQTDPSLFYLQDSRGYYTAAAPDGTVLHGSSALKRYRSNPRDYQKWAIAKLALALCSAGKGSPPLRVAAEEALREFSPTRYQNFGSIVDAYLFRQDADCRRFEQTEKTETLLRARRRANDIRMHPEVGPYATSRGMTPQVAHRWQDPASLIWCRMRLDAVDYLDSRPVYWDLKVWSRSHPGMIWRNIETFGVDIQMPLYRRGAIHLWGPEVGRRLRCGLLICDPKAGGRIDLRWIPDAKIDEWDDKLSILLENLATSYARGIFHAPGEVGELHN